MRVWRDYNFYSRTGIKIMLIFFILSAVFLLSYKFLAGANATQSYDMWQISYDTPWVYSVAMAYDPVNKVVYSAGGNGLPTVLGAIYRCDLTTGCDESSDWTVSLTGEIFTGIGYDSENQALYAGSGPAGIIYRCNTSSGCDANSDWSQVYDSSEQFLYKFTFDSANKVMYVGTSPNGKILRCAASSGCDESSDWTISTSTTQTVIRGMTFDSTNNVLYAGGGPDGVIYRCDTTTGCDGDNNDWTVSYDTTENRIWSLAFDSENGILYAGSGDDGSGVGGNGLIYRCNTISNCDEASDWSIVYDATEIRIGSLVYNSVTDQIYAGVHDGAHIYRCSTSSGCDDSSDWILSYNPNNESETELLDGVTDAYGFTYFGSGYGGIIYKNGFQPDLMVKKEDETNYIGDGIYNTDAEVQQKSANFYSGFKTTFDIILQNDTASTTNYKLKATGGVTECFTYPCWTEDLVRYYNALSGGDDITSSLTSSEGLIVSMAANETKYFRLEVSAPSDFPSGFGGGWSMGVYNNTVLIDTIGFNVTTLGSPPGPPNYKIDALIKASSSDIYIGNDIYNEDATNQIATSSVRENDKAIYYVELQNESNSASSIVVKSNPIVNCLKAEGCPDMVKFFNEADGKEITSEVLSDGWISPLISINGFLDIRVEVQPFSFIDEVDVLIKSWPYYDVGKIDAVKAATKLIKFQPDLMAKKAESNEIYEGDDYYTSDSINQEKIINIRAGDKAIFEVKYENDGNSEDSFILKGDSITCSLIYCWRLKYLDSAGNDITDIMTGSGSTTPILAAKESDKFFVELTSDARMPIGEFFSINIEAVSNSLFLSHLPIITPTPIPINSSYNETIPNQTNSSQTKMVLSATAAIPEEIKDVMRLTARVLYREDEPIPSDYRPDGLIALKDLVYVGDDIYNEDANNQIVIQDIYPGEQADFNIKLENDGLQDDYFVVKSEPIVCFNPPCWIMNFYDENNNDITQDVISENGYKTSLIQSNGFINLIMKVKSDGSFNSGSSFSKLINISSFKDNSKKDAVKSVTLIKGFPTPQPTTTIKPPELPIPKAGETILPSISPSLMPTLTPTNLFPTEAPKTSIQMTPLPIELVLPSPIVKSIQAVPQVIKAPVKKVLSPKAQNIDSFISSSIALANTIPIIATESSLILWFQNILNFVLIKQRILDFILFIPSVIFRKKRKTWGIVFDAITFKPIQGAIVKLVNAETFEQKDVVITDSFGRFSLIVDPTLLGKEDEKYILKVEKQGYDFPSSNYVTLNNQTSYYGQIISHADIVSGVLTINIPLMPSVYEKRLNLALKIFNNISRILKKITLPMLILGFLFSLFITAFYPKTINILTSLFYIVLVTANIYIAFKGFKGYAKIIDKSNKQPIGFATVRLFDANKSRLVATKVTTNDGKFNFLVSAGKFYFTVSAFGYKTKISDIFVVDKNHGIAGIEVELEKI